MSWLSEFLHKPLAYAQEHPWKTGALLAPLALAGGAFAAPALFGAEAAGAGIAGAAGAGEAAAGGAGLFGGAEAGGGGLAGLFGGEAAGGGAGLFGGGEAGASALGFAGEEALGGVGAELPFNAAPVEYSGLGGSLGDSAGAVDALGGGAPDAGGFGGAGKEAGGGIWDSLWSGAKNSVTKNPLGIAAAGAGLGMNLMRGNPTSPEQEKLKQQAGQLGAQGQQFMQYLSDGTLPPAMQAKMQQATEAAKARIVSNHARNGMPTDPSQNSALAQELSAVDMNAVSAMAQAQIDMMKTGLNETGLSSQLYEMLIKMDRQSNDQLMSAISSFASALGGGGRTIQVKT